jgi:hypothetical protein
MLGGTSLLICARITSFSERAAAQARLDERPGGGLGEGDPVTGRTEAPA